MSGASPCEIHRVAVIGGGHIGHGVAQLFAAHGFPVALFNRGATSSERAFARIRFNLEDEIQNGRTTEAAALATLGRIRAETEIVKAAEGADFVVEAVAEDLALKHEVFVLLDRVCAPPAILASDTSGMSITEIARVVQHPERVVGTHFFTPPHLTPGVEVIPGDLTTVETVERTMALLRAVGKQPAVVKNVIGFVAGRLSTALRREAWAIVEQGIATPAEVDVIWRTTVGPSYQAAGPLGVSDASGMDVLVAVHDYIEPVLSPPSRPTAFVRERAERGEFGIKSGGGFYQWTPERAAAMMRRRARLLAFLQDELVREQAEASAGW
ncbi:MAG: 3-hydroxyacyl-CoA dehydrogenase family protein [Chloroflexi bacterium]|nr:3-hydroxyacyl-CoA dehydrogenase family protein [Chloroflexota bacterium]